MDGSDQQQTPADTHHLYQNLKKKHPLLNKQPKIIQDLYHIAQDRSAFKALARSAVIQAQREQQTIEFAEPPELDL